MAQDAKIGSDKMSKGERRKETTEKQLLKFLRGLGAIKLCLCSRIYCRWNGEGKCWRPRTYTENYPESKFLIISCPWSEPRREEKK